MNEKRALLLTQYSSSKQIWPSFHYPPPLWPTPSLPQWKPNPSNTPSNPKTIWQSIKNANQTKSHWRCNSWVEGCCWHARGKGCIIGGLVWEKVGRGEGRSAVMPFFHWRPRDPPVLLGWNSLNHCWELQSGATQWGIDFLLYLNFFGMQLNTKINSILFFFRLNDWIINTMDKLCNHLFIN